MWKQKNKYLKHCSCLNNVRSFRACVPPGWRGAEMQKTVMTQMRQQRAIQERWTDLYERRRARRAAAEAFIYCTVFVFIYRCFLFLFFHYELGIFIFLWYVFFFAFVIGTLPLILSYKINDCVFVCFSNWQYVLHTPSGVKVLNSTRDWHRFYYFHYFLFNTEVIRVPYLLKGICPKRKQHPHTVALFNIVFIHLKYLL